MHTDAHIPSFAHADDAGMDLYACEESTIAPGARAQVRTGLAMAVPQGYVGLVWDKSSVAYTRGVKTMAGVLDAGYRGELLVVVLNIGDAPYTFQKGDKIAQILIQKIEHPDIVEVEALDDTERGTGGFGSTGK